VQAGDIKAEVLGENKWVKTGLNGTTHALLTVDRPVRIEAFVESDFSLSILVYEGLEKKEDEVPIATLGRISTPDSSWISHADGSLTTIHHKV
jgi:hypothetical protein